MLARQHYGAGLDPTLKRSGDIGGSLEPSGPHPAPWGYSQDAGGQIEQRTRPVVAVPVPQSGVGSRHVRWRRAVCLRGDGSPPLLAGRYLAAPPLLFKLFSGGSGRLPDEYRFWSPCFGIFSGRSAEILPDHGCGSESGNLGMVVSRRYLHHVHPAEPHASQTP